VFLDKKIFSVTGINFADSIFRGFTVCAIREDKINYGIEVAKNKHLERTLKSDITGFLMSLNLWRN
jgi:hypothetical protein